MENIIYYFSGRGNSLSAARALAQRTGAEPRPMAAAEGEVRLSGGSVGLMMPVIDFGIPGIVRRFIGKLRACGNAPYVYAVITCGGMPGASLLQVKGLLKKQGLTLSAGWIIKFELERMPAGEWTALLDGIAAVAGGKSSLLLPKVKPLDRLMTGLNPLARAMIPAEDKKFRVSADCSGCGTCAKVCPVKNIEMTEGRPAWQHRCEQCAACFSWCPRAAISGACLAARTHYTNPETKLEQMVLKGAAEE